jgi:hypothetical protein
MCGDARGTFTLAVQKKFCESQFINAVSRCAAPQHWTGRSGQA